MSYTMISADDHIDLGYLPQRLVDRAPAASLCASARRTSKTAARRASTGCATARPGRTIAASAGLPGESHPTGSRRGGVGEAHRPTTPEKRLTDMDRDGVEASLMFPPIIAMQVGEPELTQCLRASVQRLGAGFRQDRAEALFPRRHALLRRRRKPRAMKSSAWRSWVSAKPTSWSTMSRSK